MLSTQLKRSVIPLFDKEEVVLRSGIELKAMRMFRGYSQKQMSEKLRVHFGMIEMYETARGRVNELTSQKYVEVLKLKASEVKRVRKALYGSVQKVETDREIPDVIKDDVRIKCGNKCFKCGDKEFLHFHHIRKYSKGGLHTVDNLILLCAPCHAATHKGEREYHLLKSIADKTSGMRWRDNGKRQGKRNIEKS